MTIEYNLNVLLSLDGLVMNETVMEVDSLNSVRSKFVYLNDSTLSEAEDGELVDENCDAPKRAPTPLPNANIEDKLVQRAKRFGIVSISENGSTSDKAIQRLYSSMGVNKDTRLEALHLFGTDAMKTQDVFEYFQGYSPASVEWISDKTCNVVWLNEKSAALALLACSIKIKGQDNDNITALSSDSSDEECISVKDLRFALPPGIWRKGQTRPYALNVFVRFASRLDRKGYRKDVHYSNSGDFPARTMVFPDAGDESIKKVIHESGNPWADIARQWGRFEQKGSKEKPLVRDARELIKMREGKETRPLPDARELLTPSKERICGSSSNRTVPIGKMQADIEERKILKRKLSQVPTSSHETDNIDLRYKLGQKRLRTPSNQYSDDSDEELQSEGSDIKKRLGTAAWSSFDSYNSSDSDDIETKPCSIDLRQKLKKAPNSFNPPSPLQIEIDNDIYYNKNLRVSSES